MYLYVPEASYLNLMISPIESKLYATQINLFTLENIYEVLTSSQNCCCQ